MIASRRPPAPPANAESGPAAASLPAYRTELDGLRALAVVVVIVNHLDANLLPSGFLGVDVFFVISGFVITRSLANRAPMAPGAYLRDFYRRRVQRLVPSLVLCVAITALLTCLFVPDPAPSLTTGLAALFGLSNLQLHAASTDYFGSEAALNPFTQTWSLGVEEQFYLVYPLLGLLVGFGPGSRRLPRRFVVTLLGVGALSLVAFVVANESDPIGAYLLTHLRLWELAAGGLLVPLEVMASRAGGARARRGLTLASAAALLILLAINTVPAREITWSTPAAVLATGTLIVALRPGSGPQRLLNHPWLRHIGLISYPLYLWHWSVISLARWTVGVEGWVLPVLVLLMVAAAEASYHWVETPLRRRPWPGGARGTLLLSLGVNGLLAGVLALLGPGDFGRRLYAGSPTTTLTEERRRQRVEGTTIKAEPCLVSRTSHPDRRTFEGLTRTCSSPPVGGTPAGPRLFVVGDSHAAALLPLENRLHAEGVPLTHLSKAGCPFPATAYGHDLPGCERFQRRTARFVLENGRPGDVVLIASYHLAHLGNDDQSRDEFFDAEGKVETNARRKGLLYARALRVFAEEAQRRNLKVALLGAGPRLNHRDRCLPEWFRIGERMRACEESFQRDLRAARRINRQLLRRLPEGVTFIDPLRLLCQDGCSREGMRRLLIDADHLSEQAVLLLEPPLRGLLGPQGARQTPD